jgi:hemerythrin-like metal-binding protein
MMTEERFRHYTVGVPKLDEEHWHAFQLMDAMISHLKKGEYDEADFGLDLLAAFVNEHNKVEDELMERINYPYRKWHLESNNKIIAKAKHLKELVLAKHVNRHQINDFEDAILNHIDHEDRKLAEFIRTLPQVPEVVVQNFYPTVDHCIDNYLSASGYAGQQGEKNVN